MLPVESALRIILENTPTLAECEVAIPHALGHVLAEDIRADMDMPPFDKSAMDGFAVRSADVRNTPVELEIIEEIPAGKFPTKKITKGKTSRIMTGAPLPEGADAVVMVEHTEHCASPNLVRILKAVDKGKNVCMKAEDIRKGEIVLRKGTLLRPPEIGILAAVGKKSVLVFRKPTIALLTTGNELVNVSSHPEPGQIRDSNSYSLSAQALRRGLCPVYLGISRDNPDELRKMFTKGFEHDIFIFTGGVSVGEYDYSEKALADLDARILFNRVAIKPGKPIVFARKNNTLIFGLPGNPVSTYVTFEVFAYPAIRKMMGHQEPLPQTQRARLLADIRKTSERTQYLPGLLTTAAPETSTQWCVTPIEWHGSADLFSIAKANCFIIVPANSVPLERDSFVEVLQIE